MKKTNFLKNFFEDRPVFCQHRLYFILGLQTCTLVLIDQVQLSSVVRSQKKRNKKNKGKRRGKKRDKCPQRVSPYLDLWKSPNQIMA